MGFLQSGVREALGLVLPLTSHTDIRIASAGCGQGLRTVGEGIVCAALAQLWKQQLHFWGLIQGKKSTAQPPVLKEKKKKKNLVK